MEVANSTPALAVVVRVALMDEGEEFAEVFAPALFNLAAGQLDHVLRFSVPRPALGDLVAACNHEPTLYGRELQLTAYCENGPKAVELRWAEPRFNPETDRARHEAMQRAIRFGRGIETEADRRADALATLMERHDRRQDQQ